MIRYQSICKFRNMISKNKKLMNYEENCIQKKEPKQSILQLDL